MKYTINSVRERKIESISKVLKECALTDETGKVYEKVTLWNNDWVSTWNDIKQGAVLTGEIKETEKNGYKNITLYPEKPATPPRRSPAAITQAMETKNTNIVQAQERKADAVKLAGTARDATLLTVAMIQHKGLSISEENVKEMWQEWRSWLLTEFDQQPPF